MSPPLSSGAPRSAVRGAWGLWNPASLPPCQPGGPAFLPPALSSYRPHPCPVSGLRPQKLVLGTVLPRVACEPRGQPSGSPGWAGFSAQPVSKCLLSDAWLLASPWAGTVTSWICGPRLREQSRIRLLRPHQDSTGWTGPAWLAVRTPACAVWLRPSAHEARWGWREAPGGGDRALDCPPKSEH